MAYQKILILDAQGNLVGPSIDFGSDTQKTVTIAYQSGDANLSGVGVQFNFDSSGLSVADVDNVFTGAVAGGDLSDDGQSLAFGWASLFSQFPALVTGDADPLSTDYSQALTLGTVTLNKIGDNTDVSLEYTSFQAGAETYNLNAPVIPLEVTEVAIDENSGDGQVIATVDNAADGAAFTLVDNTNYGVIDDSSNIDLPEPTPAQVISEATPATQHVYISDSQFSEDGTQIILTVGYSADSASLSGIGLNLHFDSDVLAVNNVSNVFTGAIASGEQSADSGDTDSSSPTDQVLSFGWASLFNAFPGDTSASLATVTFDVIDNAGGNTDINITETSKQAGYTFDGQSFNAQLPISTQPPLTIDAETGSVTLNVNPDFESVPQYDFRIVETVGDAGRFSDVSVSIGNVDELSPVFAQSSVAVDVAEDATGAIFTANADDSADASDGVAYSLSGADASLLSIDENSGAVTVADGLDYEAKTSYSFTVTANDGVTTPATQDVTVNVTNVDEKAPIFDKGPEDTTSIVENTTGAVYQAAASDDSADATSGSITYSLVDDANGLFTIDGSGEVSITVAQDYETATPLSFTLRATDGAGNAADQTVTVTIDNADEIGPTVDSPIAADVAENTAVGTVVYTATATDSTDDAEHPGDITFSLGAGSDSAVQISASGEVTLAEEPDFEGPTGSYSFSVIATDGAGNEGAPQPVTLTVTDVPDSKPSWQSADTADAVDENANPDVVYTANANAVSADGQLVTIAKYELVDDANGLFSIDELSGEVSLTAVLDHEAVTEHSFSVQATDSAGNVSDVKTVKLPVNDLDELPPVVSGQIGSVNLTNGTGENQVIFDPSNPVLGESAVDNDGDVSGGLVFALSFDEDNQQYANDFAIDSSTGVVTYKPDPSGSLVIDYAVVVTDQAGNVAVDQDGEAVEEIPLSITILDVEYNVPIFETPDGYVADVLTEAVQNEGTVNETLVPFVQSVVKGGDLSDITDGGVVYTAKATDATAQLSYSVTPAILVSENTSSTDAVYSANAAGYVSVDLLGNVSIHGQPWADGASSYSFTVTATDSSDNSSYQIVTLSDLNGYAGSAIESADVTYSLVTADGETQGLGIDSATGDVYFVDSADYETKDHYVFDVVATDSNGDTTTQQINLHVVDVDDAAPTITSVGSVAIEEDATGTVYTVESDDADATYSLGGDDADSFTIDSGVVSLVGIADAETQSEYNITVTATDAAGNSSDQAVTISVNDKDETGPTFTSPDSVVIDENVTGSIYTATAHDRNSQISNGPIRQEFVQNTDGTLTVKFFVDTNLYDSTYLQTADFDFNFAADHAGILAVESIEYPSDPIIKMENDSVDGQIVFGLVLDLASNPYQVNGSDALAEVTFKVGDPTIAAKFSVSNVTLGDAIKTELKTGATVTEYVMDAPNVKPDSDEPAVTFGLRDSEGVSVSDHDGFAIDAVGNVTITDANFEAAEERSFTVVASDGTNKSEQTVTVTLNNIDEVAPEFESGAEATAIDENSGSGQVVYTASVDDLHYDDQDNPVELESNGVTFSLSGTDAEAFVIGAQSGEVTLLDNPDFESQSTYSFDVIAFDGVHESTKSVTLDINNLDEVAPVITSGSQGNAQDENPSINANTVIYTASSDDVHYDQGNPVELESNGVTYSLAATNSPSIEIDEDTGVVSVIGSINHERLAEYNFTVVATDDAGNASRKAVTVAVNDIDESPAVFTSGKTAININENLPAGTVVYKATVDDSVDMGDKNNITYDLTLDGDASDFDIDHQTGVVTLKSSPDFETKSEYTFVVSVSDGVNTSLSDPITLSINDLDEVAPVFTSGESAGSLAENSGSNQVVYTATANDLHSGEKTSDGFTFALAGEDADSFTIDAESGVVRLIDNPDYDEKSTYSFSVIAIDNAGNEIRDDQGNQVNPEQNVTLQVTPESKIVVAHHGNNHHVKGVKIVAAEKEVVSDGRHSTAIDVTEESTFVLSKEIEDADVKNVVNSADALAVLRMAIGLGDKSEGVEYVYNADLDFNRIDPLTDPDAVNVLNDYDLRQMAADITGDGRVSSRDALEILRISVRMEDAKPSEWLFAQVKNPVDSVDDTAVFKAFVRGDANASWNNSDYDATRQTDKGASFTTADRIEVIKESPVDTVIHKVAADDDTYDVTYTTEQAGIAVDEKTGIVTITDTALFKDLDFFEVIAKDADDNVSSQTVTIERVDPADTVAPEITSPDHVAIDEHDSSNSVIYEAQSDEDGVTFTLGAGSDPALSINDAGQVILANTPDEDIQSEYVFALVANDEAGNQSVQKTTVAINARDEVAPTILSASSANSIDENTSGQVVYKAIATDADYHTKESITFSLRDETADLAIDPDTGAVRLLNPVDAELESTISFTLVADDGTQESTKVVTIAVNDLDDKAPTILSSDTAAVKEHSGAGQVVYTAEAVDNDDDVSHGVVYSLDGPNKDLFTIDAATGEVRLLENPDFDEAASEESANTLNFSVIATDLAGNQSSSNDVALTIENIDDAAPVITLTQESPSVLENSVIPEGGLLAYSVDVSDDSEVNTFLSFDSDKAVSLVDGNIYLNESPDHELQKIYNFTVVATDSEGNSSSETATISVVDVDDAAPVIKSDSKGSVVEGAREGLVIYSADASDVGDDKESTLSYELVVNSPLVVGVAEPQKVAAGKQLVFVGSDTIQEGNQIEVDVDYLADSNDLTGLGLRVHYDSSKLSFVEMKNVLENDSIFDSEDHVNSDNPADSFVSIAWASVDGDWTGGELPEDLFSAVFDVISSDAASTQISFSAISTTLGYEFEGVSQDLKLSPLSIDSATGEVSLDSEANFESLSEVDFTIVAKDESGNEASRDVVISVDNKDEKAPVVDSSDDAGTIVENSGAGQLIYTATSDDSADISESTATYSLENHDSSLIINSKTGEVYLLANPNYEAGSTISFTVVVEDAVGSSSKDVTLTVANVDEVAPTFGVNEVVSVNENSEAKLVYTADAVNDIDVDDITDHSITYTLGNDSHSAFSIVSDSGQVFFNDSADFETPENYVFTVVATDAAGNSSEKALSLTINNLDEQAPVFVDSNYSEVVHEGFGFRYDLPEALDNTNGEVSSGVNYELVGEDAEQFRFDSFGDIVSLNNAFDYETKTEYSFTVVATDNANNTSDASRQDVTVSILDYDEVDPVITSANTAEAIRDNHVGSIYTPDGYDEHNEVEFSVVGNSNVELIGNEVVLASTADLTGLSTVDFTLVAKDNDAITYNYVNTVSKDVSIPVVRGLETVSPAITSDAVNKGVVHSYTNNSDGTVSLKLSISKDTDFEDAQLTNIDFELTSTSVIDLNKLSVAADTTMQIINPIAESNGKSIRVGQVYNEGYDTEAGVAILEYNLGVPSGSGDTFTVSNIIIGSTEASVAGSSSTLAGLPDNADIRTAGNDVVTLDDGFANVDLGAGSDTFIVAPNYDGDIVVDFVSGEDTIDVTDFLVANSATDALQVSGSTPDIADLIANSDDSLDNAFGGYFNSETDVLTLFVDTNADVAVTDVTTVEITLDSSEFNDDDLSVNFDHFGSLYA